MTQTRQYRFYVNNGRVEYFPGLENCFLIQWPPDDTIQGRVLRDEFQLPFAPTAIITTGRITNCEKNRTKKTLYEKGHEVAVF